MKPSNKISTHWSATIMRGNEVMVETTVASGSLCNDGKMNKSKLIRTIQGAIDVAKRGNVISLTITIQPRQ